MHIHYRHIGVNHWGAADASHFHVHESYVTKMYKLQINADPLIYLLGYATTDRVEKYLYLDSMNKMNNLKNRKKVIHWESS